MEDSFDPIETFKKLMNNWWKITMVAIFGGLLGLIISFFQPPTYQAEAIIHASIDFTEINYENLVGEWGQPVVFTQFEEDLALQVVERVLIGERNDAIDFARTLDPNIDGREFRDNHQIRRYLGMWYLRYRHPDPVIAQSIVNFWAENGMDALFEAQASGRAEDFVIIDLVSMASLPQAPLYHNRNAQVLAGTLMGLFMGILGVDFRGRFLEKGGAGS